MRKHAEEMGPVENLIPLNAAEMKVFCLNDDPGTRPLDRLDKAARRGAKVEVFKLNVKPEDLGTVYNLLSKLDLSSLTEFELYSGIYRTIGRSLISPLLYHGVLLGVQGPPLTVANGFFYKSRVSPPLAGLESAPAIIADLLGRIHSSTQFPPLTVKLKTINGLEKLQPIRNLVHLIKLENPQRESVWGERSIPFSIDLRGFSALKTLEIKGFSCRIFNITSPPLKTVDFLGTGKGILLKEVNCPDLEELKVSVDGPAALYGYAFTSSPQTNERGDLLLFELNTTHLASDGIWSRGDDKLFDGPLTKLDWNVHPDCIIVAE